MILIEERPCPVFGKKYFLSACGLAAKKEFASFLSKGSTTNPLKSPWPGAPLWWSEPTDPHVWLSLFLDGLPRLLGKATSHPALSFTLPARMLGSRCSLHPALQDVQTSWDSVHKAQFASPAGANSSLWGMQTTQIPSEAASYLLDFLHFPRLCWHLCQGHVLAGSIGQTSAHLWEVMLRRGRRRVQVLSGAQKGAPGT